MSSATREGVPETGQALEVVTSVVRLLRQAAAGAGSGGGGLSLTEYRLLKRVAHRLRLARELAAELDVTPATVSAAVDALVRRGLVQRHDPGEDRRAVPLGATTQGQVALEAARQRQYEALSGVLERLRPMERRALLLGLAGLARTLDATRPC